MHAHLEVVELFGALDPVDVAGHGDLGVRRADRVERVDDIVGRERIAVVELHAAAQVELDRLVVHQLPGRRQERLDLERVGIAIDQPVPGLMRDDDTGAELVEIRVDIGDRVAEDDAQGVGGFLRHRGRGDEAGAERADQQGGSEGHGSSPAGQEREV
jgi:hypothetical protein